jgi:hypothetical protein
MEKLKLDELICLNAWEIAWSDGQKDSTESKATENEKNIVRAMRAFFKMDVDRFNIKLKSYESITELLVQLEDKDPITKILSRYAALHVAWRENEGKEESNLSDSENEYISKITVSIKIPSFIKLEIRTDVQDAAYKLVREISNLNFLADKDLLNLIEIEKEEGIIYERSVKPLLKAFFNSLEKNNLYDVWEANYLALIKYKSELQDLFGKMDLKEFDTRYKELKPLISNLNKEKIAKEKQLAKELADKEKQLAKEKAELEKNKIHEYSVANGIHYCRYCGGGEKWRSHECQRELGHKYTLRRVQNKVGFDYSFQPVCNNCGDIRHYCNMDWEYKFKCETK